jgi:hypothetical protein
MKTPLSLAAVAAALPLLCSCTSTVSDSNHHGGAGTAFPPTSTTVYRIATGKTTGVQPGEQVGYRFKWTGDASANATGFREFYGSVWTTGHFTTLIPGCANSNCPLEPGEGDFVSAAQAVNGGQRVDWDTIASTGFDGFDFSTDAEPVYADVYVDGMHTPSVVFFPSADTGAVASPTALPFAATSK